MDLYLKSIEERQNLRAKALSLFYKGYGYKKIASALGVPSSTTREWVQEMKAGVFEPTFHKTQLSSNQIHDLRQCYEQGLTPLETMNLTGIKQCTARKYFKIFSHENSISQERV